MNAFEYLRPESPAQALEQIALLPEDAGSDAPTRFIAGGTNLLDLMKENILHPIRLIDIKRLPFDEIAETADGGFRLGALARNADTAYHPLIRSRVPLLSTAILAGASPQIRNMATNGGNLMQRTRCLYFYDVGTPCNKREPGSGCTAIGGFARQHAILGASEHCIATHPSDMCVALAALDAVVHVRSSRGARQIPFVDFHRLPGDRPEQDNTLAPDELIEAIELPPVAHLARHSVYLKIRERQSYAFALVSVAVALAIDDRQTISDARIALGGVAHKPWRRPEVDRKLVGLPAGQLPFDDIAAEIIAGARAEGEGPGNNGFKIALARRAIVRGLMQALDRTVTNLGDNT